MKKINFSDIVIFENDNYIVAWTNSGEWLEYSLDVPEAMSVNIMVEAAIQNADFHLEINDKQVTNVISVTEDGGSYTFEERWFNDIFLQKGIQKLKLVIDKGDMKKIRENENCSRFLHFLPSNGRRIFWMRKCKMKKIQCRSSYWNVV